MVAILVALTGASIATAEPALGAPTAEVRIEGERFHGRFEGTSVSDALALLGRQSGATVDALRIDPGRPLHATFAGARLEDVLDRILDGESFIVIYDGSGRPRHIAVYPPSSSRKEPKGTGAPVPHENPEVALAPRASADMNLDTVDVGVTETSPVIPPPIPAPRSRRERRLAEETLEQVDAWFNREADLEGLDAEVSPYFPVGSVVAFDGRVPRLPPGEVFARDEADSDSLPSSP